MFGLTGFVREALKFPNIFPRAHHMVDVQVAAPRTPRGAAIDGLKQAPDGLKPPE